MNNQQIHNWVLRASNEYFRENHFEYGYVQGTYNIGFNPAGYLNVVIYSGETFEGVKRMQIALGIKEGRVIFSDSKKPTIEGNEPAKKFVSMLEEKVREEGSLLMRLLRVETAPTNPNKVGVKMHVVYTIEEDILSNEV